jgi:hypothetical protein
VLPAGRDALAESLMDTQSRRGGQEHLQMLTGAMSLHIGGKMFTLIRFATSRNGRKRKRKEEYYLATGSLRFPLRLCAQCLRFTKPLH